MQFLDPLHRNRQKLFFKVRLVSFDGTHELIFLTWSLKLYTHLQDQPLKRRGDDYDSLKVELDLNLLLFFSSDWHPSKHPTYL